MKTTAMMKGIGQRVTGAVRFAVVAGCILLCISLQKLKAAPLVPIECLDPATVAAAKAAAEGGDMEMQSLIGQCYECGQCVPQDIDQAIYWYRKAAEQWDRDGMYRLGMLYLKGKGVPADNEEAVKWISQAAHLGHGRAMAVLACCYHEGTSVPKDDEKCLEWLRWASQFGCDEAGELMKKLGEDPWETQEDYLLRKNYKKYRKGALKGDATSQWKLGACYENGAGVEKDASQAVQWYRCAADQGDAEAMCRLGKCYMSGTGVTKNRKQAVLLYRTAAEQGNAEGLYQLGMSYMGKKSPSEEDREKAVKCYRKASARNHADATLSLAQAYSSGRGVPKDMQKARELARKAAELGSYNARFLFPAWANRRE